MTLLLRLSRPKFAIVLTRDLEAGLARPAILRKMIAALEQEADVTCLRLRNIFELRSASQIVAAMLAWLAGLLRGAPLALQCLLYGSQRECARLAEVLEAGGFDAVYLDTVRCQMLLRHLRRQAPRLHIVTDFDDLMSRRMRLLAEQGLPLLGGHAATSLPGWLRHLAEGPLAGRLVRHEAGALARAEMEAARACDRVVMISCREADAFASALAGPDRAKLRVIPPPVTVKALPWDERAALRFIFIGSDRLLQNRLAIDELVGMWRHLAPATTLHIYGSQQRRPQPIAGMVWHGFAQNLCEVYGPGSILLYPARLAGGVKTKIAEAWSYGCPVLGNPTAFEGLAITDYPFALPESDWAPLLRNPHQYRSQWARAAKRGQDFVAKALSPELFRERWTEALRSPLANDNLGKGMRRR